MNQNISTDSNDNDHQRDRLDINNQPHKSDINNTNHIQSQPTHSTSTTTISTTTTSANSNNNNFTPITNNIQNEINNFNSNIHNTNSTKVSQNEQIIAQQLLNAYLIDDQVQDVIKMASILLQSSSPNTPFNFEPFMQLRAQQYTGIIEPHDQILFNYRIFQAALYTNSPIIIDSIMPYINIDFTTLSSDQTNELIINQQSPILEAIIDATRQGHYQSILHLINKYHLPPTIKYQARFSFPSNLFYYSTCHNNNLQLIEYLLPLCFNSTSPDVLHSSILNITKHGYLHLIKKLKDEYEVDLLHGIGEGLFTAAILSNNIQLIDYLIEDIGFNPNADESHALYYAMKYHQWNIVQHFITKYNINISVGFNPLQYISSDKNITPDMFDFLITTFNTDMSTINEPISTIEPPLLFSFVQQNGNIIMLKHLINKYNANPHYLYSYEGSHCSLLNWALKPQATPFISTSIQIVEYLCELGLDVNQRGYQGYSPIYSAARCHYDSTQTILSILQLLIKHGAKIDDVCDLIYHASQYSQWPIIQYLIETYQPHITEQSKFINTNLLHDAVSSKNPSIEFISFLLSLNIFNINGKDKDDKTPIQYAMSAKNGNLDVIKLLIQHGATVTIDDWANLFTQGLNTTSNTHRFFECLDHFEDTFGWDMDTYSLDNTKAIKIQPLLANSINNTFVTPITIKMSINYRIFIHRYKANINECSNDNNSVLHHLASNAHMQLLRFSLLSPHYKPNINLVNNHGETFLHRLISFPSSYNPPLKDDDRITHDNELEHVLDLVVDILTK